MRHVGTPHGTSTLPYYVIRNPHEHCRLEYKLGECTSYRASLSL